MFFCLSLLRGGRVIFLSRSSFFFGRSGSCPERFADMSGSSSEQLVRFLHVVIRKRSGSSSLHLISSLASKPFCKKGRSQELAPPRGARLSSKPFCKKGRSQELAPTRGARFLCEGDIICPCHIPFSEEPSGPLLLSLSVADMGLGHSLFPPPFSPADF